MKLISSDAGHYANRKLARGPTWARLIQRYPNPRPPASLLTVFMRAGQGRRQGWVTYTLQRVIVGLSAGNDSLLL